MTNEHVINLNPVQYLELEKIGLGAFDPLGGFMDEAQFRSVVNTLRLPGGGVFTVPVVLDVNESLAKTLQDATEVNLMYSGKTVGILKPNDFFQCDRNCSEVKYKLQKRCKLRPRPRPLHQPAILILILGFIFIDYIL